jgi:hypothetical protein
MLPLSRIQSYANWREFAPNHVSYAAFVSTWIGRAKKAGATLTLKPRELVPIPGKFTRVRARGERSYTFLAGLERASAISDVCERYYSKKGRREFKLRRKERQSQSRQMRLALRHFSKPSRHNPRPSAVIFEEARCEDLHEPTGQPQRLAHEVGAGDRCVGGEPAV